MPKVIRNSVNICQSSVCPIPTVAEPAEALGRIPDINGTQRSGDAIVSLCHSALKWSSFDEIEWDDASVIDICGMFG